MRHKHDEGCSCCGKPVDLPIQLRQDNAILNDDQITTPLHCGLCLREKPNGVSPMEWARFSVGFTERGLQVWCTRHNANVMHLELPGHTPYRVNTFRVDT